MQKLWIVRRSNHPGSELNASYIFNDVGGETASEIIERAGLKGTNVAEVAIMDDDPNFFVAQPGASSEEVLKLIELVQTQVSERLEINLETAIQIW